MAKLTLTDPTKIAAARRGLGMSCSDLGLELGLAFTQANAAKRHKYAGDTIRRWERDGAPPWGWLAIRCLFYDRGLAPPA